MNHYSNAMGQIYLYNSLDTKKNIIRASGKLRDILPEYDFSKAVLLNNGNRIDPDFMVGDDDSVFIRAVPGSTVLAGVMIAVSIISAAAAIGTSIYAAVQNQRLEDELKKAQKQASRKNVNEDPLPFLKGAKNQSALGKDIPFVMGEMFNTPYKLYAGHYTLGGINGSEQYWHAVLNNGFGKQIIKSVSVGDVKILDLSDENEPQDKQYKITDGIYAAEQNIVEIRNSGEFADAELNQKVLAVASGDEVVYNHDDEAPTPLIKQIGDNAMGVDVEVELKGLRKMNNNGTFEKASVEVVPSWSNDNGSTWHPFTFRHYVTDPSNLNPIQHTETIEFTYEWVGLSPFNEKEAKKIATACFNHDEEQIEVLEEFGHLKVYHVSGEEKKTGTPDAKSITINKITEPSFGLAYTVEATAVWETENPADYRPVDDNIFEYNTSRTLRFVAHKDFTAAESFGKKILIKLERKNRRTNDNKTQDVVTLGYYQTYCYDPKKSSESVLVSCPPLNQRERDNTTRLGLRLIANDSTKDEINEINVICQGTARTWNGSEWSAAKTFTRNPAAWALEVLTSGTHSHSRYSDDEIDLDSFGALYEYCEEQELFCDGVVTKGEKKFDLVGKILSECFSVLIRNKENKLEVCIDREEAIPVGLINSQSVISSTVTKSFERQIDGKKVTFVNRDNWQTDTMYVMRNGTNVKGEEQTATEIAVNYATTSDHVWKITQRQLLKASLQPKEVKINVGHEGEYYPLYSTLKVQLPQMRIGNVSTVLHGIDTEAKRIELADYVTFEAGKSYGIIIEARSAKGKIEYDIPVSGNGTTNIVNYAADYDFDFEYVQYGNLVSFGELNNGSFEKVVNVMKIMGIDTTDEGVQLTLRDYNENIYKWEKGEPIPEFKSNLTPQNNSFAPASSVPYGAEYVEQQMSFVRAQAGADADSKIEAAQLKGSPMYAANIDTAVIRKLSETDYSPSVINGNCVKQSFNEQGVPEDPVENPCNWKITVNDQFEANILNSPKIAINIAELIQQIVSDYQLASLNLKKVNVKATSVNNEAVVWDEENIVVLSNDGSYVFELENEYQVYECYSEVDGVSYPNGYIKTAKETFVTPHLYMGLTELSYGTDWVYEIIPEVAGFEVTLKQSRALDGTLVVRALEGADMETEGSIKIPVFIRTTSTKEIGIGYTDGSGTEITVGYTDAGGNEYTIGYLEPDENSGIILLSFSWKKLTDTALRLDQGEKALAELDDRLSDDISDLETRVSQNKAVLDSFASDNVLSVPEKRSVYSEIERIKNEHSFYQTNNSAFTKYAAYNTAYNALISYITPLLSDMASASSVTRTEFTSKFNAYYSALEALSKEISDTPTYTFVENQTLPSNPKYGDYFLCGKAWSVYSLGLIYTYNGSSWVRDDDHVKYMNAMNDALSILEIQDLSASSAIPAVTFSKNLIAMNAVIQNLMTKTLTLQNNGVIQSQGFKSGEKGFQIKANGDAEFNNGRFNGSIDNFILNVKAPENLVYHNYTGLISKSPFVTIEGEWFQSPIMGVTYSQRLIHLKYITPDRKLVSDYAYEVRDFPYAPFEEAGMWYYPSGNNIKQEGYSYTYNGYYSKVFLNNLPNVEDIGFIENISKNQVYIEDGILKIWNENI